MSKKLFAALSLTVLLAACSTAADVTDDTSMDASSSSVEAVVDASSSSVEAVDAGTEVEVEVETTPVAE